MKWAKKKNWRLLRDHFGWALFAAPLDIQFLHQYCTQPELILRNPDPSSILIIRRMIKCMIMKVLVTQRIIVMWRWPVISFVRMRVGPLDVVVNAACIVAWTCHCPSLTRGWTNQLWWDSCLVLSRVLVPVSDGLQLIRHPRNTFANFRRQCRKLLLNSVDSYRSI